MKIQLMENSLALGQCWAGVLEQLTSWLGLQGMCLDIWLLGMISSENTASYSLPQGVSFLALTFS